MTGQHVYVDDGVSGAEFLKRPGFLRLMNALKPRPPFQVLIMSEESRLGRESIEPLYRDVLVERVWACSVCGVLVQPAARDKDLESLETSGDGLLRTVTSLVENVSPVRS